MSQLAIALSTPLVVDEFPPIVSFAAGVGLLEADDGPDLVARARLERRNRCCSRCRRVTVEPIECDDALLDRNGAPIPGTASIAGFFCHACRHEWPARMPRLAVCH
jgi:hypothetical protein